MLGTIAAGTPFPLPENETWSDMVKNTKIGMLRLIWITKNI